MTGYNAKRKMSQDKLDDDDDTQVYADTLLIVYQRGFADGKRSAQRKPLTDKQIWQMANDCLDSVTGAVKFARAIEAKLKERNT